MSEIGGDVMQHRCELYTLGRWRRSVPGDEPFDAVSRRSVRRSDCVGAAMERQARVHQPERAGKWNLLRAALIESNYALPGLMRGARMVEAALAEGRGPNPATKDKTIGTSGVEDHPLGIPR
jgi:hypothetical protein